MKLGTPWQFSLPLPFMKLVRWIPIACFIITYALPYLQAQENIEWEINALHKEGGAVSWQPDTGIATAINGVVVKYKDPIEGEAVLQADRVLSLIHI